MTIYVDDKGTVYKGKLRYHLASNDLSALHQFAKECKIAACWFHKGARRPHYDITAQQRDVAIRLGATPVTSRELIGYVHRSP